MTKRHTIAGGLAFSTIVSRLFQPTIYGLLDDLRDATSRILLRAPGVVPVDALSVLAPATG